jgi:hypothetical protein
MTKFRRLGKRGLPPVEEKAYLVKRNAPWSADQCGAVGGVNLARVREQVQSEKTDGDSDK